MATERVEKRVNWGQGQSMQTNPGFFFGGGEALENRDFLEGMTSGRKI